MVFSLSMEFRSLLRNLVISFLPVLLFIVADRFFSSRFGEQKGMQYALICAMALGAIQLLFFYIREKRLDKMTLLDTGLILAMGGVSFFSGNDLFFKLKPALIELVMVALLFVVAFFSPRLLLTMTGRLMQGMEITDMHLKLMQRNARGMFLLFLLHTILIAYAAFALSKEAWAFISGGLFYILAGAYFVFIFISGRLKRRQMLREVDGAWPGRKRTRIRKRG